MKKKPTPVPRPPRRASLHRHLPAGRIQRARHPLVTLALLASGVALLLGGLWLTSRSGVVVNRFKPQLEAELSKALNRRVTVERIEGGIFDRVILRHVRISAKALNPRSLDITIDRVVIQYSLWDILVRKKALVESLHQIEFIQPLLQYQRAPDGLWQGPDFSAMPLFQGGNGPRASIPAIRISLVSGEIRIRDAQETASVNNLRGLLNLRDPAAAHFFLSGRTAGHRLQNVKVSGLLDLTAGTFKASLNASRINLHPLEKIGNLHFMNVQKGEADLQLNFVSRPPSSRDLVPGMGVEGKLVLYDLAVRTSFTTEILKNIYGAVRLQDNHLKINNLQAIFGKTAWSARGDIDNLQDPAFNIRVQSENLQLADLVESFPRFSQLHARGSGKAAFLIKGQAADPVVAANFVMEQGKMGRLDIQKFEIISRYHAGELRLLLAQGIFARGSVDGKGSIFFPEKGEAQIQFNGLARDLAAEDIASLFNAKDIQGTVSGLLTVQGPLNQPVLTGKISAPALVVLGSRLERLNGQVNASGKSVGLDFQADWGVLKPASLKVRATQNGNGWTLQPFILSEGGRELLRAEGVWGRPEAGGSLAVRVQAHQLPIQQIPLLPPAFKHVNGFLNFDGRLEGTVKDPRFLGTFNTPSLLFWEGRSLDARGELTVNPKGLSLKNFWLDRKHIHLQADLGFDKPNTVSGRLTLSQALCQDLTALAGLGMKKDPQGSVDGSVSFSGSLSNLESEGSLGLAGFAWAGISADTGSMKFASNGKRFWLKQMELTQKQGKFNASLEADLGAGGSLQALAWMENFRIQNRNWSGNLKANGNLGKAGAEDYSGRLTVDSLTMDGKKMPVLEGQFSMKDRWLKIEQLAWGKEINLSGSVLLKKDQSAGHLKAELQSTNLEIFRGLMAGKPGLKDKLSGLASADWENHQAKLELHLDSGIQNINGELNASLSPEGKPAAYSGIFHCKDLAMPLLASLLLADPNDFPLGSVSGTLGLKSQNQALQTMSGNLEFSNFIFGQWNFKILKTAWDMDPKGLKLIQLEGLQPNGSLRGLNGVMRLNPDGTRTVALDLVADNFNFFTKHFNGHFATTGKLSLSPFDLALTVKSEDFLLNQYACGDFRAEMHYAGERLTFHSLPDYPHTIVGDLLLPPGGSVVFQRLTIADRDHEYVSLTGHVETNFASDILVKVHDVKADTVARSFGWPQPWTGVASGSVHYWEKDQNNFLKVNVKVENGSVAGLAFNSLVGNVTLDHHWLYFSGPDFSPQAAILTGDKYTMYLNGKLPLPQGSAAEERMKGAEIDMHISMPEGDFSYATFIPYIAEASGKSSLDLTLRGTMDYPSLSGRAWVHDGRVSPRLYTPLITNFDGEVRFEDNKCFIQTLQGKVGEGTLRISAGPAAPWAFFFRRLQPDQLNLRLDSEKGRIWLDSTRDYEFVSAWADVHAVIGGTLDSPLIGGTLDVGDGSFIYPAKPLTDFTRQMKGGNVGYDHFRLATKKNLRFNNDALWAQLAPDQSVVFNGGKYDLTSEGRIAISKGSFTYLDTDFTLDPNEETAVKFQGRETPRLSGLAESVIRGVEIKNEGRPRDATIYLKLHGAIGELKIDLDSEPKMTQAQIMSLLTLGEDYSNWSQEEIDQRVQSAGARVLGRLAGNLIGRELEKSIKKITPLDVIDIRLGGVGKLADNIMSGGGNTGSASAGSSLLQDTQIDVGKYLTDNLFLDYRGTVKDRGEANGGLTWQSYLGLEYNINSTKKIVINKNWDKDQNEELFLGIESRVQFQGWSPSQFEKETNEEKPTPKSTPTSFLKRFF